jgi:DNA-binding NarL/FixJ family response regulator
MNKSITLAMADDHVLLRSALASLINSFENCKVIYEADNGAELISKIQNNAGPDIVLLDLSMPVMDGWETAIWLRDYRPETRVLMLTMYDSELTLIKLLQAGVKGFLKKDIAPADLHFAIKSVMQSGYYYSTETAGRVANLFRNNPKDHSRMQNSMLDNREMQFLKLACSDLTYKEIALQMGMTPRLIDSLRDQLFLKLDVKSRVGLVMLAIRNGMVSLSD